MKRILLATMLMSAMSANADQALDCFTTAAAAYSAAVERDSGTPQSTTATVVEKMVANLDNRPLNQEALANLVEVVYDAPEVHRDEVYNRVLEQCIALTTPLPELSQTKK